MDNDDFTGADSERFGLLELDDGKPLPKPKQKAEAPEPSLQTPTPNWTPKQYKEELEEKTSSYGSGYGTGYGGGSGLQLKNQQTQQGYQIPANEKQERKIFEKLTGRTPEDWIWQFEAGKIYIHDEKSHNLLQMAYSLKK